MKRRDLLRACGLSAAALGLRPVAAAGSRPRNVLILHTDEHNFRTLGCYRKLLPTEQAFIWGPGVKVDTPHIDRLAEEGAICTSFYATSPVCSPSRSSFMSGRYSQNTPVVTNNIPMADGVVTFAEVLRRRGYDTGYAGKWHLDGTGKPQWAPKRQFGFADNRYMFNRGHWKQFEITADGPRVKARKNGKPTYDVKGADQTSFATDFLADRAAAFIREHRDRPFCYMVSFPDPHGPNTVRPPYDTMFDDLHFRNPKSMSVPAAGLPAWGKKAANNLAQAPMARYFGMVKCIDDNVGKLVKVLKECGCLDNTIVIFTADHGDLCGEHGRHNKSVPYEGSARIPFVLRAPGLVKPGTVIPQVLGCVDFFPTLMGLLGVSGGNPEGRNAAPLLTTGKAPDNWQDISFLRLGVWLAAVTPTHKLVFSTTDPPWLFDLEHDPNELVNCVQEPAKRETVRTLARALVDYVKQHHDPLGTTPGIAYDLQWAVSGQGPYDLAHRPPPPPRKR